MNLNYSLAAILLTLPVWPRPAGPPQPGTLSYSEGEVRMGGRLINRTQDHQLNPRERLETGDGRAELPLNPGTYLRVDRHSRIRLELASLSDVRLVVEQGTILLDVVHLGPEAGLEAVAGARTVRVAKRGLYRVSASESAVTVYGGGVRLCCEGPGLQAGKNQRVALTAPPKVTRVSGRPNDSFDRWSRIREKQIATARYIATGRPYWGW